MSDPYNGKKQQRVMASLIAHDAQKAIDFYKEVFDASVSFVAKYNNKIAHSEITIGNTVLMVSDEIYGEFAKSARTIGDSPVTFYYYVDNVDSVFNKAIQHGAIQMFPVHNEFYGDRIGSIIDPFGFKWTIATHVKDVNQSEMQTGLQNMMANATQTGGADDLMYKKYIKYKSKYLSKRQQI